MWEFPDIKQNRTLYAQANSNLPIRIQTVEQLTSRCSKQQRPAGCYYNRQQAKDSQAADNIFCLRYIYKKGGTPYTPILVPRAALLHLTSDRLNIDRWRQFARMPATTNR
jgi:hypothetical protein